MQSGKSCNFSLTSPGQSFTAAGGSDSAFLIAGATDCAWAATSNAAWISITSSTSGNGNAAVDYSVQPNLDLAERIGTLIIGGQTFTITQSGGADNRGPTGVFRDTSSAIRLSQEGSGTLYNAGGVFASDPTLAQNAFGDSYAIARDTFDALWVNLFSDTSQTWGSWAFAGGAVQGVPAIAVATNGTAYFSARDSFNAYWICSYTNGSGFGSWQNLGGVFSTDPVMAAAPDGSLYLVGKDQYDAIWSGRYVPGSGFEGWQFGGAVVQGKPSVTAGQDNAAYIAVRDYFNAVWMGRVSGSTWTGWFPGGGVVSANPQVATARNGLNYAVVLDPSGGVWYRAYQEGTANGWQTWTSTGGVLQSASPAVSAGELFIAGRDLNNGLWWWDQSGPTWTSIGNTGVAAGPLVAAPH